MDTTRGVIMVIWRTKYLTGYAHSFPINYSWKKLTTTSHLSAPTIVTFPPLTLHHGQTCFQVFTESIKQSRGGIQNSETSYKLSFPRVIAFRLVKIVFRFLTRGCIQHIVQTKVTLNPGLETTKRA